MGEKFQVGKKYYPWDRSYDPITVIRRTAKCIVVRGGSGNTWRMIIKKTELDSEFVTDSSVPVRWRLAFSYFADDPVVEEVLK